MFRKNDVRTSVVLSLTDIEVCGIIVSCKDHATSTEGDAVVGVSGNITQDLKEGSVGVFGGGGLLLVKLVVTNEEIVVNRSGIVEDSANYVLDTEYAFVIEGWTERILGGLLDLGAIDDGSVLVRVNLAFLVVRMIPFEAEICDVVI